MKAIKLLILSTILIAATKQVTAQSKTENFKVAGQCGMCKSKIEGAAKQAGASYALWNEDSKELIIKYNSTSSNSAKIQKNIAAVGYDTPGYKTTEEAYDKLHSCCKYERIADKESCCNGGSCTKEECKTCCKDGKCTKDMDCCKGGICSIAAHDQHNAKSGTIPSCCKKG